jgi:Protein of unknown function (DUF3238)
MIMPAQFDKVSIWIQAFIPMAIVNAVGNCFSGDDRDFSDDPDEQRFRIRSEIVISGFLGQAPEFIDFHQVGETHLVDCVSGEVLQSASAGTERMTFHDFQVGNTFPDPNGGVVDNPNELTANVLYDGESSNPLAVPSPDVDIALFFTIDPEGRTISVRGAVNAFPDYEVYARVDDGPSITLLQHRHSLDPVGGLPGGADQPVAATVSV